MGIRKYIETSRYWQTPKRTNPLPQKLTKTSECYPKEIINNLKEYSKATRQEIAEAMGDITEDGVKFNIGKLQQYGLLKNLTTLIVISKGRTVMRYSDR